MPARSKLLDDGGDASVVVCDMRGRRIAMRPTVHVLSCRRSTMAVAMLVCSPGEAFASSRTMNPASPSRNPMQYARDFRSDIAGLRAVDCGPLSRARSIEHLTALAIAINRRRKVHDARYRMVGLDPRHA